jgi:lipopolysaccharide biosynthesis regulator YciM
MRSISEAAHDMMMDVSNAKDEDDQTVRVMRQIEKRDQEIIQSIVETLFKPKMEKMKAEQDLLKGMLREGIAITDTTEMNETKLDEWVGKVKEALGENK